MAKCNWQEILGWQEEQYQELRLSGFGFLRQGKYDRAILFFQVLCTLLPESRYDKQTLGALYLQVGDNEKALKTLQEALILEKDHAPTLLNLAKAMFTLKQTQEALEIAKTLENSPDITIQKDAKALISVYS